MSGWFPERQITATETEKVLELCGGIPPQPEFVEFFLMDIGKTAFSDATRLKTHLGILGESCAEVLDVPPKIGSLFFTRGAFFTPESCKNCTHFRQVFHTKKKLLEE